jgi:hypothetical protein
MPTEESREELKERYRKAAQEYFRQQRDRNPPETVSQATQREITLTSLDQLPLPADLQRDLDEARRQLEVTRAALRVAEQGRDQEHQARLAAEQELESLRAEMEQLKRRRQHDLE